MKSLKKLGLLAMIAATAQVAALAGFSYKAVTTTTANGRTDTTTVRGMIQGEKAKIIFEDSDNPMAQEGNYILVESINKNDIWDSKMYMVNPKDKTYTEWNMRQMMEIAGATMEMMRGIVNMEFSDPKVEKLEESNGGKLQGKNTKRYKFRTSYDMSMKILGMRRHMSILNEQEVWATKDLKDPAFGVWLNGAPPTTGDEDLDKIILAEMGKFEGWVLKSKTKSTTKQYNRKRTKVKDETTTYTDLEVFELKQESFPGSTFEIPSDFNRTETAESEDGNPFKKIFGKN